MGRDPEFKFCLCRSLRVCEKETTADLSDCFFVYKLCVLNKIYAWAVVMLETIGKKDWCLKQSGKGNGSLGNVYSKFIILQLVGKNYIVD